MNVLVYVRSNIRSRASEAWVQDTLKMSGPLPPYELCSGLVDEWSAILVGFLVSVDV